jgi:hypothetical protein
MLFLPAFGVNCPTVHRIGNPIATDTVYALPQIDPFHTIRPIRTYGRIPLYLHKN